MGKIPSYFTGLGIIIIILSILALILAFKVLFFW
ncbi:Na+-transporting methylmalonyl-CoA/oxaloacetate decarboxylase gamma subunit [Chryseobacterium shigense]|uniref:Na+-transporting methylmalonyl-CoA/oxaloacetate decarboxylase gamma subunit n=1 Tax=Chryseobacterium shigense TaxID=297244 RepID=A0A841N8F2_9FLAO|nr:Na+-transporting methylmalonyl-CoA/oxaloacetate decarboxylase gamma subunit [Chryseobacterium shigense]